MYDVFIREILELGHNTPVQYPYVTCVTNLSQASPITIVNYIKSTY